MLKPSFAPTLALALLSSVPLGCTTTTVVQEAPHSPVAVPFRGAYAQIATGTFKNGRRIRVANANAAAILRVEPGRVTYDQTYAGPGGGLKRVVQTYSFGDRDVRPLAGGDIELVLTFRTMNGDTQGYNPDRNNVRVEAHRQPSGWQVDLFATDTNGVISVTEFM